MTGAPTAPSGSEGAGCPDDGDPGTVLTGPRTGERRRRRRLGAVVRGLSRRTDRALAALVVDQLTAAAQGVTLAHAATAGELPTDSAREQMATVEHEGDARRAALIRLLRSSVTSPIDREDVFRLSRSVDDVLDALRDFVRELDLFDGPPDPVYQPVLDALGAGIADLVDAVHLLPTAPREAADQALLAKKQGVRPAYQQAVAVLLDRPLDPTVLKATLLLGRLDLAGQHLSAAADALADGVVKRFQ